MLLERDLNLPFREKCSYFSELINQIIHENLESRTTSIEPEIEECFDFRHPFVQLRSIHAE